MRTRRTRHVRGVSAWSQSFAWIHSNTAFVASLCLFCTIVFWDIGWIGYWADDFILLDAARRMPSGEVLLGQHGIFPWYRPLSRELYFYLAIWTEPYSRLSTLFVSAITTSVSALALFAIGYQVHSRYIGALAAILFASHSLTKFLTAWASGFQDALSLCLILISVAFALGGRHWLGLVFAALAPFAKETGFVVFPLLILARLYRDGWRGQRGYWRPILGVAAMDILLHVLVRLTWRTEGSAFSPARDPIALLSSIGESLLQFVSAPHSFSVSALLSGVACGLIVLFIGHSRTGTHLPSPRRSDLLFAGSAVAIGLGPLVFGNLLEVSAVRTYYAFPAIPFAALLLATISTWLPRVAGLLVVASVACTSVVGTRYVTPDLQSRETWLADDPGWRECMRVSAITERYRSDLLSMADRIPSHSVIAFTRLPVGSFLLQNQDGPAVREILHDPTLRGYYLGEVPDTIPSRSLRVVTFEWQSKHLVLVPRSSPVLVSDAAQLIAAGSPRSAMPLLRYATPSDSAGLISVAYLQGAAEVCSRPEAALSRPNLYRSLPDTTSDRMRMIAFKLSPIEDEQIASAYEAVLRSPRSASNRRNAAVLLIARGLKLGAAVEVRTAIALDGGNSTDYYILGVVLSEVGQVTEAKAAFREAVHLNSPVRSGDSAAEALRRLVGAKEE